jgi:drug/metabolite transporter (DMT)-like permease
MAEQTSRKHTAGALDIRNIIGGLLGVYGVILLLMGLLGDKELDKTGDVNANLWAGVALLVVSAVFLVWARLRPIVVPEHVDSKATDERPQGH